MTKNVEQNTGIQITVSHWTLANQNLFVSDEISTVVGHDVQTNFFIVNRLMVRMNENLP